MVINAAHHEQIVLLAFEAVGKKCPRAVLAVGLLRACDDLGRRDGLGRWWVVGRMVLFGDGVVEQIDKETVGCPQGGRVQGAVQFKVQTVDVLRDRNRDARVAAQFTLRNEGGQHRVVAKVAINLETDHAATGFERQLVQSRLTVQVLIGQIHVDLVAEPDHVKPNSLLEQRQRGHFG
uniref:(northern house mosquito) hypothetical protein n=1 Tax=Culex pipiens TaxID=7175 RepID=A0A8D8FWC2_CULPI